MRSEQAWAYLAAAIAAAVAAWLLVAWRFRAAVTFVGLELGAVPQVARDHALPQALQTQRVDLHLQALQVAHQDVGGQAVEVDAQAGDAVLERGVHLRGS